jgi:hypothetical protein
MNCGTRRTAAKMTMSKPNLYCPIAGATRAEAVAAFRALPLKERRAIGTTYLGIEFKDAGGITHTMTFGIVAAEPHTRRGK